MTLTFFCAWQDHRPQTTDLKLGSPGCPLLAIPDNNHTQQGRTCNPNWPGANQPPGTPGSGCPPDQASPQLGAGFSIYAWPAEGPGTRVSGAHFKGKEKNLFPDLQRTCSTSARSTISGSSNSSTMFFHREPRKDSRIRGIRDPEGTANQTSLLKPFRGEAPCA